MELLGSEYLGLSGPASLDSPTMIDTTTLTSRDMRSTRSATALAHIRGRQPLGRLAVCGVLVGMCVIVVHIAVSPSSTYLEAAEIVPQPVQRPLPLSAGDTRTVVVSARADSSREYQIRPVALPIPLVSAPHATVSIAAGENLAQIGGPGPALIVSALAVLIAALASSVLPKRAQHWVPPGCLWRRAMAGLVMLALAGCGGPVPSRVGPAQAPDVYLSNTLDWIQEHALPPTGMDWPRVRHDALAMAPHPLTTAETYPAIRFVLLSLHDSSAFFLEPREFAELTELGVTALYPRGTVVFVQPQSPAAAAGLHEGDTLESINGDPLRPSGGEPPEGDLGAWFVDIAKAPAYHLVIRPAGQNRTVALDVAQTSARYDGEPVSRHLAGPADGAGSVGYLELPWDGGWDDYATRVQRAIRAVDSMDTCAWIVDIRRTIGGDFWTYVAGVGPILGESDLGGFSFPSGARETWAYRGARVLWDGQQRDESELADPVYKLKHQRPPVAVLTSRATFAAAELLRVAFEGRPGSRSFGERSGGKPVLQLHTTLSDGAHISLSAAQAFDRTGRTYNGPISPDEFVTTDWTRFGHEDDPVVVAAVAWLQTESNCHG